MRRRQTIERAPAGRGARSPGGHVGVGDIETRRLILKPVDPALANAIVGDRRLGGELAGAVLHRDFPDASLTAMLPGYAARGAGGDGWGLWLAHYEPERMIVGAAGFEGPPDGTGAVAIGYGMVRAHRRRGLTLEGVAALVAWAFGDNRLARILADCALDNAGSISVLEKLAFRRLGQPADGDAQRWELVRSDWRGPAPRRTRD